jgi:3'(2'), 5'-bisphosphate nucleotidase
LNLFRKAPPKNDSDSSVFQDLTPIQPLSANAMEFSSPLLTAMQTALTEAGQWAKAMARQPFEVEEKGPEDFVTAIDRTLDQRLAEQFQSWFPADGIITEENAASTALMDQNFARLWLIDPLDGTEDFIHGRPDYAIMAGLLANGQPIAGWVLRPESEQLYYGGRGWGLYQAQGLDAPKELVPTLTLGPSQDYCPMLIGIRDQHQYGDAILAAVPEAQFYTLGSFGLKVMNVILGKAGIYLYFNGRVKLWDTVGPVALALSAGLTCCDLEGEPLKFTADALDRVTLAHHQPIVIGWPCYVESLLPRLQQSLSHKFP